MQKNALDTLFLLASSDLKNWLTQKKVTNTDLIFASSLPLASEDQKKEFVELTEKAIQLRPSFAEGLQLLEVLWDLVLMQSSPEDLRQAAENKTFVDFKNALLRLRYPETFLRDQQLETHLKSLPWPQGAKVKFERRGDRAGVEFKIFMTSQADLTKVISALERVKDQL